MSTEYWKKPAYQAVTQNIPPKVSKIVTTKDYQPPITSTMSTIMTNKDAELQSQGSI